MFRELFDTRVRNMESPSLRAVFARKQDAWVC